MKFLSRFTSVAVIGLSLFNIQSAHALGVVQYRSTNTFTFNPTTGNPNQDFGTVHVQSDSPRGWILRVRSINQGKLKHATSGSAISYILTIDGENIGSLSSGEDVTVRATSTLTCQLPEDCDLPIQASIVASDVDGKPSGQYSDTLFFTLINQ